MGGRRSSELGGEGEHVQGAQLRTGYTRSCALAGTSSGSCHCGLLLSGQNFFRKWPLKAFAARSGTSSGSAEVAIVGLAAEAVTVAAIAVAAGAVAAIAVSAARPVGHLPPHSGGSRGRAPRSHGGTSGPGLRAPLDCPRAARAPRGSPAALRGHGLQSPPSSTRAAGPTPWVSFLHQIRGGFVQVPRDLVRPRS